MKGFTLRKPIGDKFPEKSKRISQHPPWRSSSIEAANQQSPNNYGFSSQEGEPSEDPYSGNSLGELWSRSFNISPFQPQDPKLVRRTASVPYKKHGESRPNAPRRPIEAPEKKITLFALRLALLEKAAGRLGSLAFIWATVVLLGGIADNLKEIDFWFITIILLTESARIFSRSHELEWQHETPISCGREEDHNYSKERSSASSKKNENRGTVFMRTFLRPFIWIYTQSVLDRNGDSVNARRGLSAVRSSLHLRRKTWSPEDAPIWPYTGWLSIATKMSRLLYCLQLLSASTCVALSLNRLTDQDFGRSDEGGVANPWAVVVVFYGLALAEALIFFLERVYWHWQIDARDLFMEVNEECRLQNIGGLQIIRSFFYDAYSECLNGSTFDGLKMDLLSFGIDLLQSSGGHGQLGGARLLSAFLQSERFSDGTLRKIACMQAVVQRLLEMLSWENPQKQGIRREAAEIVCELVRKDRNCVRVAGIAGSLESIGSLLYSHDMQLAQLMGELDNKGPAAMQYDYGSFSLLGLRILKNLAKDHGNCTKIGTARGLLPKIIGFTAAADSLRNARKTSAPAIVKTVKRSLQLLKMLSSSSGTTGRVLRQEILGVVFTVGNLRDILESAHQVMLQTLAVDVFRNLALDDDARERIGGTGGVLWKLFSLFFFREGDGIQSQVIVPHCGEALAVLSFHSTNNCLRMIDLQMGSNNVVTHLLAALNDPIRKLHSAIILRNIWAYAGSDQFHAPMKGIVAAASQILKVVMEEEQGKMQEAAVGLAAQMFKLMNRSVVDSVLKEAEITKRSLMKQVVNILEKQHSPSNKFPHIRRYSLYFLISLIQKEQRTGEFIFLYKFGLMKAIGEVMNSTTEMENFCTFSGSAGLNRHYTTVESLAQCIMDTLNHSAN